ncbi:MAG: hypothetical protein Q9228_003798 [Teloschistes exilis]
MVECRTCTAQDIYSRFFVSASPAYLENVYKIDANSYKPAVASMGKQRPPPNERRGAATRTSHAHPEKSIMMGGIEQTRHVQSLPLMSIAEAERLREDEFHARIGDPYLDGPLQSFRTPEEEADFHQRVAQLRALHAGIGSNARVMIRGPTAPRSLLGHGGQASSQSVHPDRQFLFSMAEEDATSVDDPYDYMSTPLKPPSAYHATGSNRDMVAFKPRKPGVPIEHATKVEFVTPKAAWGVKPYISTPLTVPSARPATGFGRDTIPVELRLSIEHTPKVECATPKASGGFHNALSIRLRNGPDSMTSRLDEAVAQRNVALAAQRVKLEPSRWENRKNPAVQSSWGRRPFRVAKNPAYTAKYRPAEQSRTKSAMHSYRPSDSSRVGPNGRVPHAVGSSGANAKRTRLEMEDQRKDPRSSSSEPSKRRKVAVETKPPHQMKTLAEVEATLCALNRKLRHLRNKYPEKDIVHEVEPLIKQRKLAHIRRGELDEENKKAKRLPRKPMVGSSRPPIKVEPKESERSNDDIAAETKKPDCTLEAPSSADNAELSDCVGQLATMTQKIAGWGTAFPRKSTGHASATGLTHALVGNVEQLMKTITDVRRKILGMDLATPETVPNSTMDYETAAAIDSLIASEKAAVQSGGVHLKVEYHDTSKRGRVSAAELNDEVYPCYRKDWDDDDVEMSLP